MSFDSPAIFFVNGLGDQLISLPTIRAVASLFPGRVQLMLGEGNYSFFYHGVSFRNAEPIRIWWTDSATQQIDIARILQRGACCDLFICLSTWTSPSVVELARQMGTRLSVGLFPCYDEPVLLEQYGHMFDYIFAIAQRLEPSLRFSDFITPPTYSAAAEAAAARFVARHIRPNERLLFVHPESSDSNKVWPAEHFSWVVAHFLDERPDFTAFVSRLGPTILDVNPDKHRIIYFDEHLELTLASMRYADLFLGLDSCFLHAADLFRVPSVGLFGPTKPDEWGFRVAPSFRHIYGNGSMDGIPRQAVLESLLDLTAENPSPSRSSLALLSGS